MPLRPAAAGVLAALLAAAAGAQPPAPPRPLPLEAVRVADGFWAPRLERNRKVTIPLALKQCEDTGRIANFEQAARAMKGEPAVMSGYFFNDSDVYKVLEGVAYALAAAPDDALRAKAEAIIAKIAAAQEPDGYLYTARTINDPKNPPPGGPERWSDMENGHELYCAGHLYEAAVAWREATGSTTLLDVALKNAELVRKEFRAGKRPHPCGHPEIELALFRLARATDTDTYANQARWFLETRGRTQSRKSYGTYAQDHLPVLKQEAAVGHAVRALYLYSAMTDAASLGDVRFHDAVGRLWKDVVGSKLYLTGGLGSRGNIEGFGEAFELPNASAYCETCASIAWILWNQRLFEIYEDTSYLDLIERTLYNALLSGASLDGDRFFYPNVLESPGAERASWFKCACCPSNYVRFLGLLPRLAYDTGSRDYAGSLHVNLFVAGTVTLRIGERTARLHVETRFPWEGTVTFRVETSEPVSLGLVIRIPGWTAGVPLPSGLYRFESAVRPSPLEMREEADGVESDLHGHLVANRIWNDGDRIRIEIPMPVERVRADERVETLRGRVALQRGPLVYAFEGIDQPNPAVADFVLAEDAVFEPQWREDLLGGVTVLRGPARLATKREDGGRELGEPFTATAIPYFAWANRGKTPMSVWVQR